MSSLKKVNQTEIKIQNRALDYTWLTKKKYFNKKYIFNKK